MSEQSHLPTTVRVGVMKKSEYNGAEIRSLTTDVQRRGFGEWAIVATGSVFNITSGVGDRKACLTQAQAIADELLCNAVVEETTEVTTL